MIYALSLLRVTIIGFAALVLVQNSFAQGLLCSEQGASLAARAYTSANPFVYEEQTYHDFIEDNAVMFRSGNDAEICLRRLGSVLIRVGLAQPGGQYDPDIAKRTFGGMMPGELAHLPGEVDRNIAGTAQNPKGQLVLSGLSYLWLARVLSDAANGSWTSFERLDDYTFANNWQQYMQTVQYCQLGIMSPSLCNVSTYKRWASEEESELRALALTSSPSEFDSMLINIANRGVDRFSRSLMEAMAPYID
jgi:hypothetical protein